MSKNYDKDEEPWPSLLESSIVTLFVVAALALGATNIDWEKVGGGVNTFETTTK